MISPVKPAGGHSVSSSSSSSTGINHSPTSPTSAVPKRQRRSGPLPPTPTGAFRPPTVVELRVQGVGDLVEGTIAIQQQQGGGGGQQQQQWSLERLDGWRHWAFGAKPGGQGALRQQQREMRRALLRLSSAQGATAMVSSPVKSATAAAGVGGALPLGSGGRGEGGRGSQEAEEDSAWLPGHG